MPAESWKEYLIPKQLPGTVPVYRLETTKAGAYTTPGYSTPQSYLYKRMKEKGWKYMTKPVGTTGYAYTKPGKGRIPVYLFLDPKNRRWLYAYGEEQAAEMAHPGLQPRGVQFYLPAESQLPPGPAPAEKYEEAAVPVTEFAEEEKTAAAAAREGAGEGREAIEPTKLAAPEEVLRRAVAETGSVYGTEARFPTVPSTLEAPLRQIATEAVKAYEESKPVLAAQARKAAYGLEIAGRKALETEAAIQAELGALRGQRKSAATEFQAVTAKATRHVEEAQARTLRGLDLIDTYGREIYTTMNLDRARDLQVAVQSTVGALREEERQIAQRYGPDSAEYQRFQEGKRLALATSRSNIQAAYGKLHAEIGTNIMKAKASYLERGDMYESFARQTDAELSAAMAKAESAYFLNMSDKILAYETLSAAGMENLANWVIESPVSGMDMMDIVGFMGELAIGQWESDAALAQAREAARAQKTAAKYGMWGSILGGAAGMFKFGEKRS